MMNLLLVSVFLVLEFSTVLSVIDKCHKETLFGTKTPYKMIENRSLNVTYPEKCFPIQINMVHRHGNRYPSTKDVKRMDTVINKINIEFEKTKTKLNDNIELPLKNPFSVDTDKLLSHVGEKELYELGKRIRNRFPTLFNHQYSPLAYRFTSSCKLRCTHSANALAAGLFENSGVLGNCLFQPIAIDILPCSDDPVLRFFDLCQKYRIDVINNESAMKEYKMFSKQHELSSVIEKIKLKLGFVDINFEPKDILSLFLLCAYEIGMFDGGINKGYCSLFDEEDRKILEYWYDLKHFYKRAAGYQITFTSSCKLLEDIYLLLIDAQENKKSKKHGIFRSAHAETIIPLFTLLGIYDINERLLHDNFNDMLNRSFRSACMSPFSGNLYFILYQCDDRNYKIQMYLNEHLIKIPCCQDEISCDFDLFLRCYKNIIETCHFGQMCKHTRNEL